MDCSGLKSRFVVEFEVSTEFGHMNKALEGIKKLVEMYEKGNKNIVKVRSSVIDVGVVMDENI
jgi:uncharacterized lipoprotein YajG